MILLTSLVVFLASIEQPPVPMSLSLTGVGRFAHMADAASIRRDASSVRMRVLQISEDDMIIGDKTYIGGWSWWHFDCEAGLADRLDFASLTNDLIEGPSTPDNHPAYAIRPGGDAAELSAVACADRIPQAEARSLIEAVQIGRRAFSD